MRKLFITAMVFYSVSSHSFTDTIVLAEIAATLSADLAQTLKLLDIAQEQQDKLKKVHDNIQHRTMLANRVKRRIVQIQRIGEIEVYDVRSLNSAIRDMKYYYSDAKVLSDEIAKSFILEGSKIDEYEEKKESNKKDRHDIERMTNNSLLGSYEESTKNTAINSALTNEILSDIRDTTIDLHDSIARKNNEERIQELKRQEEKSEVEKFLGIKEDQEYWSRRKGKL